MLPKAPNPFSHLALAQNSRLRVGPYQQRQSDIRHQRQQQWVPKRRTFRSWWCVPTSDETARIAKPHRQESDPCCVIKNRRINPQPKPQPIARWIIPGNSGRMSPCSRRLPDNQQFGGTRHLQNRTRSEWQMLGTDRAGAGSSNRKRQRSICANWHSIKISESSIRE